MEPAATLTMPAGTVTFLFTDIEASSRHWESQNDAMMPALRRHDELVRRAITAHHGYIFKTVGDAFCAAFETAPDAVAAAVDAQRSIAAEDFGNDIGAMRVRMALHTGQAEQRDRDYFGPTLNRTARLLDIAHGGQILISGATAALLEDWLPAKMSLRDLGTHRLRDLAHAERVHQLIAEGLASEFPALQSLETHPNNLPLQLTSFIGRDKDLADIKERLASQRLITLVGAAGVGKTRLALQAGAQVLLDYPDGVWFVDLAPVRDAQFVPTAAAKALGLVETASVSVTDLVVGFLKRRNTLVILDNCEHVIEAVAQLVDAMLKQCTDLRILATSREPINIPGEHSLRVSSLTVPEKDEPLTVDRALTYAAIALFVDRAKAVSNDFRLNESNVATIADLCRRLDGIALAIELAAAHVRVLSVGRIYEKLDDRFRLLTGGSRTALTRQRTMRALIDWSFDLLSETEQALFRRLAVFANGWTLEAVSAVCADDRLTEAEIAQALASLVDKSLVIANVGLAKERFTLFESTRQYALDKLRESGEQETFERNHAAYFAALAAGSDDAWENTPTESWLSALHPEEDNFRAALSFTLEAGRDPQRGAELAARLPRFWWTAARQVEGLRWYAAAFGANDDSALNPPLVARLWYGTAVMHSTTLMRREARESASKAVALARTVNDPNLLGWSLLTLGVACGLMGDPEQGRKHCVEGLKIALSGGYARLVAWLSWAQALNDYFAGNLERARSTLTEQLPSVRRLGDELLQGFVLVFLGNAELGLGNPEAALQSASDSYDLYLKIGDRIGAANALSNIAPCHLALGRLGELRTVARESLSLARDVQNSRAIAIAVEYLGAVAAGSGNPRVAARLLGYANAWYEKSQTPRDVTEQRADAQTMDSIRASLADAEVDNALHDGAALSEQQAIEIALSL